MSYNGVDQITAQRYDAYGRRTWKTGTTDPTEHQYAGAHGYEREPSTGQGLDLDYLQQHGDLVVKTKHFSAQSPWL